MPVTPEVRRIAVLGGGPAGLAAAAALTAPAQAGRFEVTVYQPGWRLGGKCASGRNLAAGGRIEEHGLHVWFGFYDNAFELMRETFAELDRPGSHPLGTLEQAFAPCDDLVMCDTDERGGHAFHVAFPRNGQAPGTPHPLPGIWEIAAALLGWGLRRRRLGRSGGPPGPPPATAIHRALLAPARLMEARMRRSRPHTGRPERLLARALLGARDALWEHVARERCERDPRVRLFFTTFDVLASTLAGLVRDGVLEDGWDAINDLDLCEWLRSHGAKDVTAGPDPERRAPLLRAVYDLAFAYPGGEVSAASAAAGTAASNLLRLLFAYRGSILYKMRAGMGDSVIAPLYELLHRRGVRFEFFSAATGLRTSPDGSLLEEIDVVRQTPLRGGRYEPLVEVGGLSCWPSQPRWEQLLDGESLRGREVDFELDPNPLGTEPRTLRRGEDFDAAVLAVPVGALDGLCAELAQRHEPFAAMLDSACTVATQSLQLWLTAPPSQLGWEHGANTVAGTPHREFSTWCDMSYLLDSEAWDERAQVAGVAYFCGVLPDASLAANEPQQLVRAGAREFLERRVGSIWPDAGRPGSAPWRVLAGDGGRGGADPLANQYCRANVRGSDRYVLTPAGSVSARLAPDQSGLGNLVLAGDWTRSGVDGGCVEAAVTSGLQAARALAGGGPPLAGESQTWLTDRAAAAAQMEVQR